LGDGRADNKGDLLFYEMFEAGPTARPSMAPQKDAKFSKKMRFGG
jgi:hypothetical protein